MDDRGIELRNEDDLVEAYAGVLLGLETAIHDVAYPDPTIGDGQVASALDRLIRHFQAEAAGRRGCLAYVHQFLAGGLSY